MWGVGFRSYLWSRPPTTPPPSALALILSLSLVPPPSPPPIPISQASPNPTPRTLQVDFHGSRGECRGTRADRPRRRSRRGSLTYPLNPDPEISLTLKPGT